MTSRRLPALVILVAVVVGLGGPAGAVDAGPEEAGPPAAATSDGGTPEEDPRARREAARRQQTALATDLDVLEASEAELDAAAAALATEVRAQEEAVRASQQALEAATAAISRAKAALTATENRIGVLTDRLVERAVDSFITPSQTTLHDVAVSADLTEALRKRAFVSQLLTDDTELVDELESVRAEVEVQKAEAEAAEATAERRRAENERRLADLEAAVAEQARVEAAIEERQAAVTAEIESLAATEAQLTAQIEQAEREQREREERARAEQAERDRIAAEQRAAQERTAREQTARDQSAREQAGRDQAARDQATRDRAARDEPAPSPSTAPRSPAPAATVGGTSSGTGRGGCIWPARGAVTSEYGSRWGRLHAGIDIAAPTGTPIYAARAGTVLLAGVQGGYGNAVVLDHGDMQTLYGHQSRIAVRPGAAVGQGDLIGYVGNTGRSTGPHLHFETRYGGSPRNPRSCLP